MKSIQIAQRKDFTAHLMNIEGEPKMAIRFHDKSKAAVDLGPNDYIPGYEPKRGTRACELTYISDEQKKKMKPEDVALAEKFRLSGEIFTKGEARTKYDLEAALAYHLGQLNAVCAVLQLIQSSDPIISTIPDHPADIARHLKQLASSFDLVADHIREHAHKAHEIYSENSFNIDGEAVVPECVKGDNLFRDK